MMIQVTRRELLKGAAALGAAATAPGTLTPARAQTTQKRELVVAQGGDISKFDPHFSTSSNDIRVSFNLFDNLVSRHPDGKLHPGLATEWKLHGQTQWTFKVRPGVKWHNGDPFTAADAKWSLERTWDAKVGTRVSTVFTTIDCIEAPDPATPQGRGGRAPPPPARQGGARQGHRRAQGRGRPLRGPLRPGRQREAPAAGQPAREAGAVARHRPPGDRERALAGARHRPERADREGRQPLRREARAPRLQPRRGARAAPEGGLPGRGDRHRDDRRLHGQR